MAFRPCRSQKLCQLGGSGRPSTLIPMNEIQEMNLEIQVKSLMLQGFSPDYICKRLSISLQSFKTYSSRIRADLTGSLQELAEHHSAFAYFRAEKMLSRLMVAFDREPPDLESLPVEDRISRQDDYLEHIAKATRAAITVMKFQNELLGGSNTKPASIGTQFNTLIVGSDMYDEAQKALSGMPDEGDIIDYQIADVSVTTDERLEKIEKAVEHIIHEPISAED